MNNECEIILVKLSFYIKRNVDSDDETMVIVFFPCSLTADMHVVSSIGVIFNIFNIYFLIQNRKKIRFTELFSSLLIILACFDLLYLVTGIGIFGLPLISKWYQ